MKSNELFSKFLSIFSILGPSEIHIIDKKCFLEWFIRHSSGWRFKWRNNNSLRKFLRALRMFSALSNSQYQIIEDIFSSVCWLNTQIIIIFFSITSLFNVSLVWHWVDRMKVKRKHYFFCSVVCSTKILPRHRRKPTSIYSIILFEKHFIISGLLRNTHFSVNINMKQENHRFTLLLKICEKRGWVRNVHRTYWKWNHFWCENLTNFWNLNS